MLWKSDLLDASFRGTPFAVQSLSDKGEKSLAIHEYPYRAGAEVEDLGRKARHIPVKAVFWGAKYLEQLQALITAFEQSGKGELIHPVYGSVDVSIAAWDIEHDAERPEYATVSFECVESALDNPFFAASSARSSAQKAQGSIVAGLSQAVKAATLGVTSCLETVRELPILAQTAVLEHLSSVLDVYDAARSITRTVLSYVDYPLAFCSDLAAVQQMALLAAETTGAMYDFRTFSKVSELLPRLSYAPGMPQQGYATGAGAYSTGWISGSALGRADAVLAVPASLPNTMGNLSLPASTQPGGQGAVQGAVAAYALTLQTELLAQEAQHLLMAQLDTPTLTPQEVESITGNTRQRMQDAIDYTRAAYSGASTVYAVSEGLRTAAAAMQELGAAALHARPPLVRHCTTSAGNFHLLAHSLYGDYARAPELARLNPQVRNPNFIAKGQELYVYAR